MICPWALKDEFLKTYHDEEWCRPHHDDTYLFEMLVLEGAQAAGIIDDHLESCPFRNTNRT